MRLHFPLGVTRRTIEALAESGVIVHPQIEGVQETGGNNRTCATQGRLGRP